MCVQRNKSSTKLKYIWMYFATLLKTTAPVKLPISQLSLISFSYTFRITLKDYNHAEHSLLDDQNILIFKRVL